ncbi:MAG: S-layer homology domain-containing protein [Clostridia bacterium]|nr:S-layer homology domain-containing protein [Clostridia bacterium]
MKKVLSLFLVIFMLLALSLPISAAAGENLLYNPDMEEVDDGIISGWNLGGGDAKTNRATSTKIKHGGQTAMQLMDTEEKYLYLTQTIKVVGGETYKVGGFINPFDLGGGHVAIKVELYGEDDQGQKVYLDKAETNYTTLSKGKWQEIGFEVQTDVETTEVNVMFRMNKGKVVYFDDLYFIGKKPEKPEPKPNPLYKEMPAGSQELIQNASFEEVEDATGTVKNWEAIGGWENEKKYVEVTSDSPMEGNKAVHIQTNTNNNPWARQLVYHEFKKGETYQCSAWVRIHTGIFVLKLEWHDKEDKYIGGYSTDQYASVTGEQWVQYVYNLTIPEDCSRISFYVRGFGAANLEVDCVSFYKVSDSPMLSLTTDEVFYYTEEANGIAKGTAVTEVFTDRYPELKDAKLDMQLLDGETVLYEEKGLTQTDAKVSFAYKLSLLKEEKHAYTVKASIRNQDGTLLGELSRPIYKYPRPEILDEKGHFIIDGEQFIPQLYYHVRPEQYPLVKAIGGNCVQSNAENLSGIKNCLDKAQEHGLKVMAALYKGMKPAGHPDNVANTKEVIRGIKDHPALLGYMVMDEPGQHFPGQYPMFEDSYKLIRDLDPKHVVYICEDTKENYAEFQKYVDILSIDPYPSTYSDAYVTLVGERNLAATEATAYKKPVISINQLHKYNEYMPTEAHVRNMMYQALFGGASALGHFPFYDVADGKDLDKTELYASMQKLFENGELQIAKDIFIHRAYPVFFEKRTLDAWEGAYVMDGSLYVIVVSNLREDKALSIPLVSDGGAVKVGEYTAELLYGEGTIVNGDGVLNCTLPAQDALIYKVTPKNSIDFSQINKTAYRDTIYTPWAAEAIRALESKDIVNHKTAISFAPQTNITRADFAYFLVRTLDLTADATDTFADVDPDAYYAKELAIGKATGILKGIGENRYNPEAEISRQDLMTIIARGLALSGANTDLTAFSDYAQIADYAIEGVRAMVQSGLVKGNADGTLNPLGNATRAEAAVIMQRILQR